MMDGQTALMREARLASTPDGAAARNDPTTDDAGRFVGNFLDMQGDDRLLPRGGSDPDILDEVDAAYAARLKGAWDTWGQDAALGEGAGTPGGMLKQLIVLGFPSGADGTILVNHLGIAYTYQDGSLIVGDCMTAINRQQLDGSVPTPALKGFTLDSRDQFYSRFMILFGQDVPSLTVGSLAAARLNSTVRNWKFASAIYMGSVVIAAGGVWGWPPTKKWGDGGKWGDSTATIRFIPPG